MSTAAGENPWKEGHPSVPKEWKHIGAGGNAIVWSDGQFAIKRLHPTAGKEAKLRFEREAEILKAAQGQSELRVVPLIEVREREEKTEIVMKLLDGNLDKVIHTYAGSVEKAAAALIPIAETLVTLSEFDPGIFHRDLKPTNILFSGSENDLFLADFGCAFLVGDDRITPDKRAVGAWAYRAPEYSFGAVEEVDDKGDVFSLGKVLWAMLNGQARVVFPGPVWFGPEYDLTRQFPGNTKINHAMLLISKACSIDSKRRPTMREFANGLRTLIDPIEDDRNGELLVKLLGAEAMIEVSHQQQQAATAAFVRAIFLDLVSAIETLHVESPEVTIWRVWHEASLRSPQTMEAIVEQVAMQKSDAPVVNSRFRDTALNTRFHPERATTPASFRAIVFSESSSKKLCEMTVTNTGKNIVAETKYLDEQPKSSEYRQGQLLDFLRNATGSVLIG